MYADEPNIDRSLRNEMNAHYRTQDDDLLMNKAIESAMVELFSEKD